MDRHFTCTCGGTAWVSREGGTTTIHCAACGRTASGETLTLAREEWRMRQQVGKHGSETKPVGRQTRRTS